MKSVVLLLCSLVVCVYTETQSYRVSGVLHCDDKPLAGVCIKLWNKNVGPDTEMGRCKSDARGAFECTGHASELFGNIKPKLKIYHRCARSAPGYRKVKFELPKDKITHGNQTPDANKKHDMGVLNLNTKFPGEEMELYLGLIGTC